jgi:hypothetical protein
LAAVSIRIVAGSSSSVIIRQRCRRARRGSRSRTIGSPVELGVKEGR